MEYYVKHNRFNISDSINEASSFGVVTSFDVSKESR
jgi:hypothetical protein